MRRIQINEVSEFLTKSNIDFTFLGNIDEYIEYDVKNIQATFDYSFKGRRVSGNAKLIITDKVLDRDNIFVVKNPKYVLYTVLFDLIHDSSINVKMLLFENGNYISEKSTIEEGLELGCNNSIGGVPFSFYSINSENRRVKPFAQVDIEKNVSIGSNNCIDSGIFKSTFIGNSVKLDSNIYIAHDAKIGKDSIITSGVSIGGFSVIGKNVYIGMNSSIRNGLKIGDNTTVGMGSVVTKSFGSNLVIYGNPAKIVKHKCECGRINSPSTDQKSYMCGCDLRYSINETEITKK